MLGALETEVGEYEAVVQSYRAELIATKEEPLLRYGVPSQSGNHSQKIQGSIIPSNRLKTVNIYHALPHLMDTEDALVPALAIGKNRIGGSHCNKAFCKVTGSYNDFILFEYASVNCNGDSYSEASYTKLPSHHSSESPERNASF
jgi:hypothetical protein